MSTPTHAATPKLFGVDLSHANPDIDLHALVAAGSFQFIALKATEGRSYLDPTFSGRYKRIREFLPNVIVPAYHFLRVDSPVAAQMTHFVSILKGVNYDFNVIPVIDAERGLNGEEPSASWVQSAISEFKKLVGYTPAVYTGQAYQQEHLSTLKSAYWWIARYSKSPPTVPFGIWQDAEDWTFGGNKFDHNVFFGTLDQFKKRVCRAP